MHITVVLRVHVPHMTVFSLLQVYNGLKKKEEQHLVYIYLYFVTPCSYCNLCKKNSLMRPPVLYADVVVIFIYNAGLRYYQLFGFSPINVFVFVVLLTWLLSSFAIIM